MIINIGDDILRLQSLKLLNKLLVDKTTQYNFLWSTDAYQERGILYERNREIDSKAITGHNADVMKTRARKAMEQQSERTKHHAEVFTPLFIVQRMNDHADSEYFGYPNVFYKDAVPTFRVVFEEGKSWQDYVDSRRLEITCGEAPYLTTRYDVETGEYIPIKKRIGILDRKLRVVTENAKTEEEWLKWAFRALEATYGYEFQGDNLLIARINLLTTFEENLIERLNRKPSLQEYLQAVNTISWNVWQMDGITGAIPYLPLSDTTMQVNMFGLIDGGEPQSSPWAHEAKTKQPHCRIFDWRSRESLEYLSLFSGRKRKTMKFDFIIGNPPYQENSLGENNTFDVPIYNKFMDESFAIADKVLLITPGRFLFNTGGTSAEWNLKMLSDNHFKVLYFEPNSNLIFKGKDIKGGIAITYHDIQTDFGAIETFTAFSELNTILKKIKSTIIGKKTLADIIYTQTKFNLDALYTDYPEYRMVIGSNGKDKRFRNNIFEKISVFCKEKIADDDIKVIGVVQNKRVWRYISQKYVDLTHENLFKYKVLVPAANGSGAIGEVLSTPLIGLPLIGLPLIGLTQTFISIGAFETQDEASACLKYIKSKFARTMLGILKATQHNPPEKWKYVPLQDFTSNSDIDWTQSVADIDVQLYRKYGLSQEEIAFIESHVKEMV